MNTIVTYTEADTVTGAHSALSFSAKRVGNLVIAFIGITGGILEASTVTTVGALSKIRPSSVGKYQPVHDGGVTATGNLTIYKDGTLEVIVSTKSAYMATTFVYLTDDD